MDLQRLNHKLPTKKKKHFKYTDLYKVKVMEWKEINMQILIKESWETILISDKIDFLKK